jgi:glycosyltransferase involved in cell wall biosynthesis
MVSVTGPRLALVHHWLVTRRGGERCLDTLAELLPGADLFTLVHDPVACPAPPGLGNVTTTALQRWAFGRNHFRAFLPLFARLYGSLDLSGYDLVVTSDASVAKSVKVPEGCLHVCYCYSPVRYAWDLTETYLERSVPRALRPLARIMLTAVRRADYHAAQRIDHFVAISETVAERIQRCYGKPSQVIYPPTDVEFFRPAPEGPGNPSNSNASPASATPTSDNSRPYLLLGQVVPYKRFDEGVIACRELGRPLIVAGSGPGFDDLRALAGPQTTFIPSPSDEEVRGLYQQCRALLFPGVEDFGLVPVEAMACGRPVIALGQGGATETVVHEQTGILTSESGPDVLLDGIRRFETWEHSFEPSAAVVRASLFSLESHRRAMGEFLSTLQHSD